MHFGRYGGSAENPSLVRGYDAGSFSAEECQLAVAESAGCPVFDQLLGSRMVVADAELRLALLGFFGNNPEPGLAAS
jgi:thiamine pyrophosphate-dependent acetolactate synthase large subunit-like protein